MLSTRQHACPTCGCTCGGLASRMASLQGDTRDNRAAHSDSSSSDIESFTNLKIKNNNFENDQNCNFHSRKVLRNVSTTQKFPTSRPEKPLLRRPMMSSTNVSNTPPVSSNSFSQGEEEEFHSIKSLNNKTQPTSQVFLTSPQPPAPTSMLGEEEEFHSIKSLINKTQANSQVFLTPPPPPVPTSLQDLQPTLSRYTAPPPPIVKDDPPPPLQELVRKLSSSEVSIDAKKKCLAIITKTQLTEVLVSELFSSGVLTDGVKCVLQQFKDNPTRFRREVLLLALQMFNQCLAFTKSSGMVRNFLWENSSKITGGSSGELSLIQSLVTLCDPVQVEARIDKQVCTEITSELRNVRVGVMIGKIVTSQEPKEQVGKWARVCLGTTREEVTGSCMVQDMFKLLELCFVQDGHEVRMEKLLVEKYPDHIWSVKHPVKEEGGADWSTITVVKMLPSGHAMVYTDMDWECRLARLEQELQERARTNMPVVRVKPGVLASINWSDLRLNQEQFSPLVSCQIARVMVLSVVNQGMVDVFLIDHGYRGTISASTLSLLPHHLCTLTPCIVLARIQGILPSPETDLLTPSLIALSYISNSRTVSSLLSRPSLASARIISQLLSSPQSSLLYPALSVLHMMISTLESRKHIILSSVCLQVLVPTLIHLATLSGLPQNHQSLVIESLLTLLSNLPPHQVQPFYQDGTLVDSLNKVQAGLGGSRYSGMVSSLLSLGKSSLPDKETHHSGKEAKKPNPVNRDHSQIMECSPLRKVDDIGCSSQMKTSSVKNNFISKKEKASLTSTNKCQLGQRQTNETVPDCFIPPQVQIQAAMRKQLGSSPPTRAVNQESSENTSVSSTISKVSHVKSGPNLPSWLGGSSSVSDSSSDSDTDDRSSLPTWLAAQSMEPRQHSPQ